MTELPLHLDVIGTFSVSADRESFVGEYPSREAAIANAWSELDIQPGQTFYTAQNYVPVVTVNECQFLDDVTQSALDDCGDAAQGWLADVTMSERHDLGKLLASAFGAWLRMRGKEPKFFRCENIEEHVYNP